MDEVPEFSADAIAALEGLITVFTPEEATRVKAIERRTNHDVKALEYYIKEKLENIPEVLDFKEFVHFACTSEDINNLAHGMMLKQALDEIILPAMERVVESLATLAEDLADVPMLSRTHGQVL